MTNTYWYRLEDYREARGLTGSVARLRMARFKVERETPCGVVIRGYGRDRFVNLSWNKKYAAPTEAEARKDFVARKKRQIEINEARAQAAREALLLEVVTVAPLTVTLL